MLLAIDVGNTNINMALIDKKGIIKNRYTTLTKTPGINRQLKKIALRKTVRKIIMVSVVPKTGIKVRRALNKWFKEIKILTVGRDIKVPLKCGYDKSQIGQDRLVTAFAAKKIYGLPILIIDFGTAVTFDVVSKANTYMGGLILPGIKMSLESLHERTAMLPRIFLKKTDSFIGKNTESSIRNGMIYGYAALCNGLIGLFKKHIGKGLNAVATGGDADLISHYTHSLKTVDPYLSFKGLYLLAQD